MLALGRVGESLAGSGGMKGSIVVQQKQKPGLDPQHGSRVGDLLRRIHCKHIGLNMYRQSARKAENIDEALGFQAPLICARPRML